MNGPGDLIVDSSSASKSLSTSSCKFEEEGLLAIARMKAARKELTQRTREHQELLECRITLLSSKNNLKNDLKKALSVCKGLSDQNSSFKSKCSELKQTIEESTAKLAILEKQEGLQHQSLTQLEKLEEFFLRGIDTVKNMKFKKKYEEQGWEESSIDSCRERKSHVNSFESSKLFFNW